MDITNRFILSIASWLLIRPDYYTMAVSIHRYTHQLSSNICWLPICREWNVENTSNQTAVGAVRRKGIINTQLMTWSPKLTKPILASRHDGLPGELKNPVKFSRESKPWNPFSNMPIGIYWAKFSSFFTFWWLTWRCSAFLISCMAIVIVVISRAKSPWLYIYP